MTDPLHPEVTILNGALELPVEQRSAYLDKACAGDGVLRRQVEALLCAHEQAGGFLAAPPAGLDCKRAASNHVPLTEKPGDRIGRYQLREPIGEGGCGVVYLAMQEEPVRRGVALKVIKLGMDTRSVIARFEAERQALALMDHPHIAKVLDAGATETGRPYFVMELVRGTKITEFCDENGISTPGRLKLFIQVCQAIQHAHQKGVIHRDIKPSNILVTVNDGVPGPKVIDFGIAKATQGRLTDQTLFTSFEQFIGTPAYMSPEQAAMTTQDIDTRSDIYSLGVLLYELITGCTPFDQKELLAAGLDEMRRTIREREPLKPSTRLTQELAKVGKRESGRVGKDIVSATGSPSPTFPPAHFQPSRHHDPRDLRRLIPALRGDLDWIAMKCLEKDRASRYETANGLALDIQRHLDNEPVTARPRAPLYQFGKLVQRNKLAFGAFGVLTVALLIVAVGSSVAAWRVAGARRAEQGERLKAEMANQQLRQTVSLLELERAENFFRAHDSAAGAACLAAMLRRDPSNHLAANRLVSAFAHRHWALPVRAPMRHLGPVETVCFHPKGGHVLSASRDGTAKIWEVASGRVVATLQHAEGVSAARYNPAGTALVTASADSTARIWKASDGAALAPALPHRGKVYWAEFSPDGKWVVTASADKTARLWDAVTGALKLELAGHTFPVTVARFSPDGERVATGSQSGGLRIWSTGSGGLLARLDFHQERIQALAFSPDGRRLISACHGGIARLWNVTNGQPVARPLTHKEPIDHADFSPDSQRVLTTSEDGTARLWETETGRPIGQPFMHGGRVVFGTFSPDGRLLVTTSVDNSARVWDVETGAMICQPLRQHERILWADFSPDGRYLVTASADFMVQVWDIRPRRSAPREMHAGAALTRASFSPDGRTLLTTSHDKTARWWDANSGQPRGEPMQHDQAVLYADFRTDGQRVATACVDGSVRVWDLATQQVVAGPFGHAKLTWPVRFSPEGERLLTASHDGTARLWNARTGEPLTAPWVHQEAITMAGFSPDGRRVVTVSKDCTARVWDALSGQPVSKPLTHLDHVRWADFSPDGQRIVTASSDNTAGIWEVRTSQLMAPLLRHPRTVECAVFSPDGRWVATASLDGTARIWDVRTGQAMTPPMQHDGPIIQIAFSPDGRRILAGGPSGTVRLWDAETGRPLTEPLEAGGWVASTGFDASGQRIVAAARGARIWNLPAAPMPVPPWFSSFAEAVAGIRLSARGNVELVPRSELDAIAQRLAENGRNDYYERLARWFLADPGSRPREPF